MTDDAQPVRAAETLRTIIAGLRAVDDATASSPYDPGEVGDVLRGVRHAIGQVTPVPERSSADRTGISRDAIRLSLDRFPPELAALTVRLGNASEDDWPALKRDIRRNLVALAVTVDSILATSTFRKGPVHEAGR